MDVFAPRARSPLGRKVHVHYVGGVPELHSLALQRYETRYQYLCQHDVVYRVLREHQQRVLPQLPDARLSGLDWLVDLVLTSIALPVAKRAIFLRLSIMRAWSLWLPGSLLDFTS